MTVVGIETLIRLSCGDFIVINRMISLPCKAFDHVVNEILPFRISGTHDGTAGTAAFQTEVALFGTDGVFSGMTAELEVVSAVFAVVETETVGVVFAGSMAVHSSP